MASLATPAIPAIPALPAPSQSVVIHGHFYQPPREDPWLDEIEAEGSATPYHDWNERIERECYRAVVAAHLTGAQGRIVGIVNTLEWISFNFGATLLTWMEQHAPSTYQAILEADRASELRLGKGLGNAIAQPYHHIILPLASRRDKRTEVLWGVADFRRRFGREPLGMWLPETAMDHETLDVLAECGIRFTILAPHQVEKPPPNGLPGAYRAANGKIVALFMYDGDVSHGVAFGGLLHNAGDWAARMLRPKPRSGTASSAPSVQLVSVATDGETYGHHHKFAEMALARVITDLRTRPNVTVENFASFLSRYAPAHDVKLVEPSSWSCPHGVERWRSNCGCRVNGEEYPSQAWRTPLRGGLDVLAAGLHALFETEGKEYFADPWRARDEYLQHPIPDARTPNPDPRARELLEMEYDALRMYSSCAWFFDDIGGLEPRQVLRYAAHACDLAGNSDSKLRDELEAALLSYLAQAKSNDPDDVGTGADVYERHVRPRVSTDIRTAASLAAARALGIDPRTAAPHAFDAHVTGDRVMLRVVRTGRTAQLEAEATASLDEQAEVSARVKRDGAASSQLVHLNDFPERARRMIRSKLRQRLVEASLSPQELAELMDGGTSLRDLAGRALVRFIEQLANESDNGQALRRAQTVLDLLEHLESGIPFDAQAAWWRVRSQVTGNRATQVAALGERLGFAIIEN